MAMANTGTLYGSSKNKKRHFIVITRTVNVTNTITDLGLSSNKNPNSDEPNILKQIPRVMRGIILRKV